MSRLRAEGLVWVAVAVASGAFACGVNVVGDGIGGADGAHGIAPDATVNDGPRAMQGQDAAPTYDSSRAEAAKDVSVGRNDASNVRDAGRDARHDSPLDSAVRESSTSDAPSTDACAGGCDAAIVVAFGSDLSTVPWPEGGMATYSDTCEAGSAIIGVQGDVDNNQGYWDDIAALCGSVTIDPSTSAINITLTGSTPVRGYTSEGNSTVARVPCPTGQVVVGFAANAGNGESHVHGLNLVCAPVAASPSSPGGYTVSWSNPDTVMGAGSLGNGTWSQAIKCSSMTAAANEIEDSFSAGGLTSIAFGCASMTAP
jgi:hypothetical protein